MKKVPTEKHFSEVKWTSSLGWILGRHYLPGNLSAAFLWAQMEAAVDIMHRRLEMWNTCHFELKALEDLGQLRRPIIPEDCVHNAPMYYILLPSIDDRTA